MTQRMFGRIESPYDRRDFALKNFIPVKIDVSEPDCMSWEFPLDALNQGDTPACVGFSMADWGINFPTFTLYTNKDGHQFYKLCKEVDGMPDEDGSTIRAAAKVLKDVGAIEAYAFARDLKSIKWWILNRGPVIAGTAWTSEMMSPDEDNKLDTDGFLLGGHAYILNEWTEDDYIGIQNSWGNEWGKKGKAYIAAKDFEDLFYYGGEALAAVELENYKAKEESWIVKLIRQILEWIFNEK